VKRHFSLLKGIIFQPAGYFRSYYEPAGFFAEFICFYGEIKGIKIFLQFVCFPLLYKYFDQRKNSS